MAQKRTPSRAQRRTPRVRCFVSVAAMQQSSHFIAAARLTSAPRAALLPEPPNANARAARALTRLPTLPPSLSGAARALGRGRHGCRHELELGLHCSSSSKRLVALNPLPPASPPSTWPRELLPGFPSPPVRVAAGAVTAADACAHGQANPARLQPN